MAGLKMKKEHIFLLKVLAVKKFQSQTECEFEIDVHQSFYTFTPPPHPLCGKHCVIPNVKQKQGFDSQIWKQNRKHSNLEGIAVVGGKL